MFCPQIDDIEVRNDFNSIVKMFDGKPLSIEEFKSVKLRNKRKDNDLFAINVAYKIWNITKGKNIPTNKIDIINRILDDEKINYNDNINNINNQLTELSKDFLKKNIINKILKYASKNFKKPILLFKAINSNKFIDSYDKAIEYLNNNLEKTEISKQSEKSETKKSISNTFKIDQYEIIIMPDSKMVYKNGKEVTDETIKNKVLIKQQYDENRIIEYNNSKYFILNDNRIISLNKTSKGREVYKSGSQREKILNKLNRNISGSILGMRKNKIIYTNDQKNALLKIENFLNSNDNFFLLAGFAGTGKTTIAENIANYSKGMLLAPTNAAVKRLKEKFNADKDDNNFSTIHKVLYGSPDPETGEWINKGLGNDEVYIIDEASMIDEKILNDLIKEAKLGNNKIIFLGDGFQLEPVGKNPELFKWNKEIFKKENKYELQEVKRQDGDILLSATDLRTNNDNIYNPNSDEFKKVSNFGQELVDDIKNNKEYVVIVSTNKNRLFYNRKIREVKYGDKANNAINNNEKLISVSNNAFMNSDIYTVKNPEIIKKFEEEINVGTEFNPRNIKLKGILIYHDTILNNKEVSTYTLLFPELPIPSLHGSQLLTNEFFHQQPFSFYNGKENIWDKKVNIATYGYSITAHKSQGNEWNNVYIDADWISDKWNKNRWIYTAITRAKSKVRIKTNIYKFKSNIENLKKENINEKKLELYLAEEDKLNLKKENIGLINLDNNVFEDKINDADLSPLILNNNENKNKQNIKGENITSKGSKFARKLTNPGNNLQIKIKTKSGKTYIFKNSEHAYQTFKSGKFDDLAYRQGNKGVFKPRGRFKADISKSFNIIVRILELKFEQHPELIKGIDERGGLEYLNKSTHEGFGDKFWEGPNGGFMRALKEAYNNVKKNSDDNIYYQNNTNQSDEDYVASEKTIRDLAERMAYRIGLDIEFENPQIIYRDGQWIVIDNEIKSKNKDIYYANSKEDAEEWLDNNKNYKGYLKDNTAIINLNHATLDTPIHEILGHPIIRAIKNRQYKFDVLLPIGTSRSGKSTFIKSLPQKNLVVIEPDAMRVEFTGNINDKSKDKEIYAEAAKRAINALKEGKQVVFDTTNLTKEKRLPFIRAIKKEIPTANIQYKLMELNPELAKKRIKAQLERGENRAAVSDKTIDRHAASYKQMLEDIKSEPISNFNEETSLYQSLLKELETGRGKEVLDRVKKYYKYKELSFKYRDEKKIEFGDYYTFKQYIKNSENFPNVKIVEKKYSLEEQQEEAIVQLLGEYIADRLDKVKDKNLISLLKELWEQMTDYMKSLFSKREVKIEELRPDMTLGNLADLLAYRNSKLILPGYEVIYTTPDNKTFKTYQEANNHITKLFKLKKINLDDYDDSVIPVDKFEIENEDIFKDDELEKFAEINKDFNLSIKIIKKWLKTNNIIYNPEEIYSRGQGFYSIVGGYSNFDLELMLQNLLNNIEDNKKAKIEFIVSALTKPINKRITKLEGFGNKIRIKIFPKSEDIKWAANRDVHSGSVWDSYAYFDKYLKKETAGISYTKAPESKSLNAVQPNLTNIINKLTYDHNELAIALTYNNFRIEYDDDVPYSTKKLIDGINDILDKRYGKLIEPKIKVQNDNNSYTLIKKMVKLKKRIKLLSYGKKYSNKNNELIKELKEQVEVIEKKLKDLEVNGEKKPTITYNNLKKDINDIYEEVINNENEEDDPKIKANVKIAALKEGMRKYPRILIRSKVKPINNNNNLFDVDEFPFQKVTKSEIENTLENFASDLSNRFNIPVELISEENAKEILNSSKNVFEQKLKIIKELENLKNIEKQKVDIPINEKLLNLLNPVLIELNNKNMNSLIVGGAVRDALLGKKPKDIDIEIYNVSLEELQSILEKYGKVNEVGKSFGILKFIPYKKGTTELVDIEEPFDFSIPRRENKTGKGYTGFKTEFDKNITIKEAAERRDFTWNSLGYNPISKTLYDYYGGIKDLKEGIIRHVSDKFKEDPLRILRAMQFQSRMGYKLASETANLIRDMVEKNMIDELPKERIEQEWLKWAIKGSNPQLIFDFLRDTGIGKKYFPKLIKLKDIEQDFEYHPEGDVEEHTKQVMNVANNIAKRENLNADEKAVLMFSALLHDIGKIDTTKKTFVPKKNREVITSRGHEAKSAEISEKFLKKLGIRNSIIKKVIPIIKEHLAHATITSIQDIKGQKSAFIKLSKRLESASIEELVRLMEADMLGRNNKNTPVPETIKKFNELLKEFKKEFGDSKKIKPLITGKDLLALGFKTGKELGNIVKAAMEAQINLEFTNRKDALEWLSNYLKNKYQINKKLEGQNFYQENNSDIPSGFYNSETKKAYLVKGKADKTSAIHEIFTHPFLLQIEKTNPELYNNLLEEAKSNKQVVDYVDKNYTSNKDHEYIARAIDLYAKNKLDKQKDKNLIDKIKMFWNNLIDYIKQLFNLSEIDSKNINPNTTLEELTKFVLNSNKKIDLSSNESNDNIFYQKSEDIKEQINNNITTILEELYPEINLKNIKFDIDNKNNLNALFAIVDNSDKKEDEYYLPYQYVHQYLEWFKDTPIVREGIEKWGSKEKLVEEVTNQVILQKGEANRWWKTFIHWIIKSFNNLAKATKERLRRTLADAFLLRIDLDYPTETIPYPNQKSYKNEKERIKKLIINDIFNRYRNNLDRIEDDSLIIKKGINGELVASKINMDYGSGIVYYDFYNNTNEIVIAPSKEYIKKVMNNNDIIERNFSDDFVPTLYTLDEEDLLPLSLNSNIIDLKNNFKNILNTNIKELEQRINRLRIKKRNSNPKEIKELDTEISKLYHIIENLNNIYELLKKKNVDYIKFLNSMINDHKYLIENILMKDPIKNKIEIQNIINFYKNIGNFEIDNKNLLFTKELLKMIGVDESLKEIKDLLYKIKDDFIGIENKLKNILADKVNEILSTSPLLKNFEGLTIEKLIKNKPDISIWDMMMQNLSTNTFSEDSLIPQIMLSEMRKAIDEANGDMAKVLNKLDTVQLKVEKKLKEYKSLGITATSYDIFFEKNLDGTKTGKLINIFSPKWFKDFKNKVIKEKNVKPKYRWLLKNANIIDINKLTDIVEKYKGTEFEEFLEEDKEYTENLKKILNPRLYNKIIKEIIENIEEFRAKSNVSEELIDGRIKDDEEHKEKIKNYLKYKNELSNPFYVAKYFEKNHGLSDNGYTLDIRYTTFLPKQKIKYKDAYTNKEIEKDTGYYNKDFKYILEDEDLYNYWEALEDALKYINITFSDQYHSLPASSIPAIENTFIEIMLDSNKKGTISSKKKSIFKNFLNSFSKNFVISKTIYDNEIVNKGINKKFYDRKQTELKTTIDKLLIYWKSINGKDIINNIHNLTNSQLTFLAEQFNVKPDINLLKKYIGILNIDVKELMYKIALNRITNESSQDIPRIIRTALTAAATYNARLETEPIMNTLKEYYTNIEKNTKIKGVMNLIEKLLNRTDKERVRANKRMEFAYNRLVKGKNKEISEKIFTGLKTKKPYYDKKIFKRFFMFLQTGALVSKEEFKEVKKFLGIRNNYLKELKKLENTNTDKAKQKELIDEIEKINNIINNVGDRLSIGSIVDGILSLIIFKGLAYNVSSAITNRIEGKFANMIADTSGLYWTPGNMGHAELFVSQGFRKRINKHSDFAKQWDILKHIIEDYKILQDTSNELQKNSVKSRFRNIHKLSPYHISISSIEFRNQGADVLAILQDTYITNAKTGEKVPIFDGNKFTAFEVVNDTLRLKEEFRSQENIDNWENFKGDNYNTFKNKVLQAIASIHGDYESLGGMLLKSNPAGRAVSLFKTWLPNQIWQRFATEQESIFTKDKKVKGRYRSFTPISGGIFGATIGLIGGPITSLITGALGATIASFNNVNTEIGFIKELAIVSFNILKKSLFTPLHLFGIATKYGQANLKSLKLNELDTKNLQANIADISILLAMIAFKLMLSSLRGADDDDDEEGKYKHKLYLFFENKIMNLISNATLYAKPKDIYNNYSQISLVTWLQNVIKLLGDIEKSIFGELNKTKNNKHPLLRDTNRAFIPAFVNYGGLGNYTKKDWTIPSKDYWDRKLIKEKKEKKKKEKKKK